jgi:hypothetical protein
MNLDNVYAFNNTLDEESKKITDKLNFKDILGMLKKDNMYSYYTLRKDGVRENIFVYILGFTDIDEKRKNIYIKAMGNVYEKALEFGVLKEEDIEKYITSAVDSIKGDKDFNIQDIDDIVYHKIQDKIILKKDENIEDRVWKNDGQKKEYENFLNIYSNSINSFYVEKLVILFIEENIDKIDVTKLDNVLEDKKFFEYMPFSNYIIFDELKTCLKEDKTFKIDDLKIDLENKLKGELDFSERENNKKALNLIEIYDKTGDFRCTDLNLSRECIDNLDKYTLNKACINNNGVLTQRDILLNAVFKDKYFNLSENDKHILGNHLCGFELDNLSKDDILFFYLNREKILTLNITQLQLFKNITCNKKVVELLENMPQNIRADIEDLSIGGRAKDVENIVVALSKYKGNYVKEEEKFENIQRNLSSLPKEKREEFEKFCTSKVPKVYKANLGLPKDLTFGLEFEVKGISLNSMGNLFESKKLLDELFKRQNLDFDLSRWKAKADCTVKGGLELTSPVLKDTKNDWEEIKQVSSLLKSLGAYADEDCGGHIHIGANILGTNQKAYEKFFKICSSCEDVIYKMSNPPGDKLRNSIYKQAAPTKPIVDEIIQKGYINISSKEDVIDLANIYSDSYIENLTSAGRGKLFNLENISKNGINTIEFRQFNEVTNLDYVEKQRNIFLPASIITKSISEDSNFKNKEKIYERLIDEKTPEEEKALCFVDYMFDDIMDKVVYYERYLAYDKELKIGGIEYEEYKNGTVKGIREIQGR